MYVSLKWKAVVFLSLVLITITAAWTWQIIDKQLDSFQIELSHTHSEHTALLTELINDSFLKLSQFSQLISSKQVVSDSLNKPGNNELNNSFERDWISYNINLGLDYLVIYDFNYSILGEIKSGDLLIDEQLITVMSRKLHESSLADEPQYFIYCNHSCLQFVLEPFINKEGRKGVIVLAQNMADIVRVYYDFSKSGIGILVSGDNNNIGISRHLPNWNLNSWAVSDFNKIFPVLKAYSFSSNIKNNSQNLLFTNNKKHYLIKLMQLPNIDLLGNPAYFISVDDKTSAYELMNINIKRGTLTGALGLIIAEFILLALINSPMKKLRNITEALHLLPKQNFYKAIEKVKSNKSIIKDELTTLEASTAYVASELNKLHNEINLKNQSLEKQIHALTRSRSFLTRLFDNSQIFIITQNLDYTILSTNKKFDTLCESPPKNFRLLFCSNNEFDDFNEQISSLKSHKVDSFQQEINLVDKNNKTLIITWTHAIVEDEEGNEIILSIGMDQTQQKNAENNLRWMANHDSLTSIGNRRSFNAAFKEMLDNKINGALVFIDVNRFKQINDIYGHNAGDLVLVDIANKLGKLTRSTDIISRFAGDEFTILLTNLNRDALPAVLDKISKSLNSSLQTENNRIIHYSTSLGASLFPEHGLDPQTLIINADMAMYHAKKKGMGHWHIFDAEDDRVVQMKHDHTLMLSIKNALKTGSFELVYQPILEINTGRVSHYEALIRMHDEMGNNISPAVFIPLAERTGEIRNIDEWVLDNALLSLSTISSENTNISFAINISAPTLQTNDFPDLIFRIIDKYSIEPAQIIIELTETSYIENFQQVLKNLKQVTKHGVRVALDDFGVGFSSFTYLKMLPLSYVKLDGSYIRNLTKNLDDQVFVKSLSAMINAFGMKTIAEFVEDRETLDMIEELGVSHGQGYYISKPVSFDTVVQTIKSNSIYSPQN